MSNAILLSGGIDSIALAYWKRPDFAFTVNYGQSPAVAEQEASMKVCEALGIEHIIIDADCSKLGSGDLLKSEALSIAPSSEWWPYRNQLLVTLACMKAIQLNVTNVLVGSVSSDGFHKDGTATFYSLLNSLVQFQEGSLVIEAPAVELSSVDLVLNSGVVPEILYYAHSCHKENIPCSHCRGCYKYIDVIQKLNNAGWG
jgi:7-cyano-7-deazaguanine synthase